MMVVLIDNGHGQETPGKRSPDGKVREYIYTRQLADYIVSGLRDRAIYATLLTPENEDVPLKERCKRANKWCELRGTDNVLLVSLHLDAAGDGSQWTKAQGWSARVSLNAGNESKRLAGCLFDAAVQAGLKMRQPSPGQKYWEQNLAICRDTLCPAVLTENLFMDNREEAAYLLTAEGMVTLAKLHIEGILKFCRR